MSKEAAQDFSKICLQLFKESFIEWLKYRQQDDGSWESSTNTGFAILILSLAGVQPNENWLNQNGVVSNIKKAIGYLRSENRRGNWSSRVWDVAIILRGLVKNGENIEQEYIRKNLDWLANNWGFTTSSHHAAQCMLLFNDVGLPNLSDSIKYKILEGKLAPIENGSWRNDPHDTGLVVYSLVEYGLRANDIRIQNALRWLEEIKKTKSDMFGTKKLCCSLIAYSRATKETNNSFVRELFQEFLNRTSVSDSGASLKNEFGLTLFGLWALAELDRTGSSIDILSTSEKNIRKIMATKFNLLQFIRSANKKVDKKIKHLESDFKILKRIEMGKVIPVDSTIYFLLRVGALGSIIMIAVYIFLFRNMLFPLFQYSEGLLSIILVVSAVWAIVYAVLKKKEEIE